MYSNTAAISHTTTAGEDFDPGGVMGGWDDQSGNS